MIQGKLQERAVTYVIEQVGACAWYRCRTPGMALANAGHRIDLTNNLDRARLASSRVVVWQRPSLPAVVDHIAEAKRRGVLTIVEIDDDLWHIGPKNPARASWARDGGAPLRVLEECMRRCDRVTTTTPALAESVRFLNRDVRILPNMLPDEMWPVPAKREHRAVVIGWAGSPTHHEDIRLLAGVVETVVMRHPEVSFAFVGMKPPFNEHRRIVSLPPVATDGYAALISRFDIGLAPVVQTRFNAAKSDLKYLEYAAVGIPTIASAGPTYASLEHGVTGYRAGSPAEWLKAIEKLLDRPRREMMGAAARTYAESRFMSANVRLWEEAYGL